MKLGVHIGYWGLGLSSEDQLKIVQEAERLGYDSVWAAEAYGSDTATVLGWLAGQTSKIRLGWLIRRPPTPSSRRFFAARAMTCRTRSNSPLSRRSWAQCCTQGFRLQPRRPCR